jgi:hypothetical protein
MSIDWSKAPEWAEYHVMDSNGDTYWFANEPQPGSLEWFNQSGGGAVKLHELAKDWKESLVIRPKEVSTKSTKTFAELNPEFIPLLKHLGML